MRSKTIFDSWGKIKPSDEACVRMFGNIQNRMHQDNYVAKKKPNLKAAIPVAACFVIVLFLAVTLPFSGTVTLVPTQPISTPSSGSYLTQVVSSPSPGMFMQSNVRRFHNQDVNSLIASWQAEGYNISWQIPTPTGNNSRHIVSAYLSIYAIPFADSGEFLQQGVNPMFLESGLSLVAIQAQNWQINFSVLHGGTGPAAPSKAPQGIGVKPMLT